MMFLIVCISLSFSLICGLLSPFVFMPFEHLAQSQSKKSQKTDQILEDYVFFENQFKERKITERQWLAKKEELQKKYIFEKTTHLD